MNVWEKHPSKDQLIAFGLGKLDPDEADQVAEHLYDCRDCSETIVNLEDDTFVSLVRNSPAPESINDDDLVSGERDIQQVTVDVVSGSTGGVREPEELPPELAEHPRYEIFGLIGKGGMGDVYIARHRKMERTVALKVINRDLVRKPEAVDRFHREVKMAAQLSHPNIVTAHDADQTGDYHFMVMEYVDGVDLSHIIKDRGALPIAEACDYVLQAAIGMQYAHEQGMVHRDIKPHNLMVTEDGTLKILDFGLASLAPEALQDPETVEARGDLTAAGSIMGTPDFISPEQADDARQADVRSDIYSLGATLYSLLSGQPPFAEGSVRHKLKSHAHSEPEALELLRDDIPDDLVAVVSKMMAKDSDERFQTSAEVAEALRRFAQATQSVKAMLPEPQAQPRRRRSRVWPFTAVATLFVATIIAAIVSYIQTDKGTGRWSVQNRGNVPGSGGVVSVAFSRNGRTLVTGSDRGKISFWDAETGSHLRTVKRHGASYISGLQFSKDGKRVLCGSRSGLLMWLDADSGKEVASHRDSGGYLTSFALTPDENQAVFTRRSSLLVVDADFACPSKALGFGQQFATSAGDVRLTFSGDGEMVVYGDMLGKIRVWDLTTRRQIKELESQLMTTAIRAVAFAKNAHVFAVAGLGGIEIYDARSFDIIASMELDKTIDCIAFHPSGTRIASGSRDGSVRIWDARGGNLVQTLPAARHYTKGGPGGEIWCLSWSADGKRLATGTRIRAEVWDIEQGERTVTFAE